LDPDPDPDGPGEPDDLRRGVFSCPAPEAVDPRSRNGAGARALLVDEEEGGPRCRWGLAHERGGGGGPGRRGGGR
jgi:hypothetical protein